MLSQSWNRHRLILWIPKSHTVFWASEAPWQRNTAETKELRVSGELGQFTPKSNKLRYP